MEVSTERRNCLFHISVAEHTVNAPMLFFCYRFFGDQLIRSMILTVVRLLESQVFSLASQVLFNNTYMMKVFSLSSGVVRLTKSRDTCLTIGVSRSIAMLKRMSGGSYIHTQVVKCKTFLPMR